MLYRLLYLNFKNYLLSPPVAPLIFVIFPVGKYWVYPFMIGGGAIVFFTHRSNILNGLQSLVAKDIFLNQAKK